METIRTCPVCGDEIVGRIDKKFCSDQCRSTFNNSTNKDTNNYVRRVNHILRKNRKILADLNPEGKTKVSRQTLHDRGFNFNYYTNTYRTKNGNLYFFCYDQGYLPVENQWYALVEKQDYVR